MAARTAKPAFRKTPSRRLEDLLGEATVDANDDSEQLAGIESCLDDNLDLPFETTLLGQKVTVDAVKLGEDGSICAQCGVGRAKQWVPLFYLPDPPKRPEGWEWVEAYRHWCKGRF